MKNKYAFMFLGHFVFHNTWCVMQSLRPVSKTAELVPNPQIPLRVKIETSRQMHRSCQQRPAHTHVKLSRRENEQGSPRIRATCGTAAPPASLVKQRAALQTAIVSNVRHAGSPDRRKLQKLRLEISDHAASNGRPIGVCHGTGCNNRL